MKVQLHTQPQKFIVVDNYLDADHLRAARQELTGLEKHLMAGQILRDGKAVDNPFKKKNNNLWLDDHYRGHREDSALLRAFREGLRTPDLLAAMEGTGDLLFANALHANADCTLLSVYGRGDFYAEHQDEYPSVTCNLMLCEEPRRFTGGDFHLADDSVFHPERPRKYTRVEFRDNRLVIFPGRTFHYVDAVHGPDDLPYLARRFSVQFWSQYVTAGV